MFSVEEGMKNRNALFVKEKKVKEIFSLKLSVIYLNLVKCIFAHGLPKWCQW